MWKQGALGLVIKYVIKDQSIPSSLLDGFSCGRGPLAMVPGRGKMATTVPVHT